jgi:hypothetical protein
MIKTATSVTVWNDAVGKRMSITYSEVDEATGKVISDNNREDKVITGKNEKALIEDLLSLAQEKISD